MVVGNRRDPRFRFRLNHPTLTRISTMAAGPTSPASYPAIRPPGIEATPGSAERGNPSLSKQPDLCRASKTIGSRRMG
jgi:hypothetical protein